MNVAILHYHFNRGGVTQVVLNQLRAIDERGPHANQFRFALVHGGRCEGVSPEQLAGFQNIALSQHTIAALDYDDGSNPRPAELAREIRQTLEAAGMPPENSLLHIHNHSLGKNVSLPGAIAQLAAAGYRVLLQIHDFAEDFRPDNYRRIAAAAARSNQADILYPQASHIHYAVLNGRDYRIVEQLGVPADHLHRLPNAVGEFGELPSREDAREKLGRLFDVPSTAAYVVYPVRGIRRKNLGELLLWSALAGKETVFALTLAPLNPVERPAYLKWKALAEELRLSCVFETGRDGGLSFKENLAAADYLITTSVAEGFGMVFLESWLAGRRLVGRNLPEITGDFAAAGIQLDALYPRLSTPINWIGRDDLRTSLAAELLAVHQSYGLETGTPHEIANRFDELLAGESVDFAMLNSAQQARIIRLVHGGVAKRDEILRLNPRLQAALTAEPTDAIVEKNAACVREHYSLAGCDRRLGQLYERVMASPADREVAGPPRSGAVLEAFLDASRLHPIRFE